MKIKRLFVGSFVTNCYVLLSDTEAAVIDPGDRPDKIRAACEGKPITKILLTHAHLDHTAALPKVAAGFSPQILLHEGDLPMLNDDVLRAPGWDPEESPAPMTVTRILNGGDRIELCGEIAQVLHTPGHTPGSVCFYVEKEHLLFSGDTLFRGTYGRVDFPGGDPEEMRRSLLRLYDLPGDTLVCPGHGFSTTVAEEKEGGTGL